MDIYSDYLRPGDFATNTQGTVYEVVKVNRVNTVCRDRNGKMWNVRGVLKKADKPADWPENTAPKVRPGFLVKVKPESGLFRHKWFKQYTPSTLFVVTSAAPAKVSFVPLGGEGMPESTTGYSVGDANSLDVVPFEKYLV